MNAKPPTAIIADDEEPLRNYLRSLLEEVWPELKICGMAANGAEAVRLAKKWNPQIAFLDIRMPGLTGMEAARAIAPTSRIVFVTAYDEYAVEAFEKEAVDYLLKPVTKERLLKTVKRLRRHLSESVALSTDLSNLAEMLANRFSGTPGKTHLQWLRIQKGSGIKLIPVSEVVYFQASDKYTAVITRAGESLIKKSIRDLVEELDPECFWQIHRGTIVNVSQIEKVSRSLTGRGVLRLKDIPETLTVSRPYLHLFKEM